MLARAATLLIPWPAATEVATSPLLGRRCLRNVGHRWPMPRSLQANRKVVGFLYSFGLSPSRVEEIAKTAGRGLAQLVAAGNLDEESQVPYFLVITHQAVQPNRAPASIR